MEVHFVHKSAKDPTALAVVGMFFELVDDAKGNKFAETLANALPKVSNCGDKTVVQGLGKILYAALLLLLLLLFKSVRGRAR